MTLAPKGARLLCLCVLGVSVLGGDWATASRAAELPLSRVKDTLSDRGAGRMRAIETPLSRDASLDVPLQKVIPAEAAGTDEQQSRALGTVLSLVPSGSMPDTFAGALAPVDPLGSGGGPPAVQSLNPASAQESAPIHPQR
jgi:hypothetical protein